MKTKLFAGTLSILTVLFFLSINGCKKDKDEPRTTTYNLKKKDVLGISGTVKFTETSSTQTTIEITLTGVTSGSHPAHIHVNSAIEGGGIAVTLNPVDATGKSTTVVDKLDDNTAISYSQLLDFDGYVNVHESASNIATIIAQGDIGGNALTGTSISYTLWEVSSSGVSGSALFEKRKNGNTLVTIMLTGTIDPGTHPAHIHIGSVTTAGGISVTLNSVDGATGKSYTHIEELDNGTAITYDGLLEYTGYINVHLSITDLVTILAQGNIGSNV